MQNRKLIYGILLSLFILCLILGGVIFYSRNSQELKVVFLNIGQGDAILIIQGKNQVLVDGGKSGKLLLERLGKFIPFWDRQIEAVVATHPDQDHIGGLASVLRNYKVETVMETKAKSKTQVYKRWEDEIEKEQAQRAEAVRGARIKFPNGALAEIIYPFCSLADSQSKDNNANSIVIKLTFGEESFLLTGDLPSKQEKILIDSGLDLQSRILKAGHHGSKHSTSAEFLKSVKSEEAIISVGKNSYGHPHSAVLGRLREQGIKFWRTDEKGNIVYKCKSQNEKCERYFD
ncbi:MBL fold metallo-hydrolase [bacterium]|nr:MBL fold metallo-hydrolase [bacterium]